MDNFFIPDVLLGVKCGQKQTRVEMDYFKQTSFFVIVLLSNYQTKETIHYTSQI